MIINSEQQQAIKNFVVKIKNQYKNQIVVLVTAYENKDCGLYVKQDNTFKDIPCLVVVHLKNGQWLAIGHDLKEYCFNLDQVL